MERKKRAHTNTAFRFSCHSFSFLSSLSLFLFLLFFRYFVHTHIYMQTPPQRRWRLGAPGERSVPQGWVEPRGHCTCRRLSPSGLCAVERPHTARKRKTAAAAAMRSEAAMAGGRAVGLAACLCSRSQSRSQLARHNARAFFFCYTVL